MRKRSRWLFTLGIAVNLLLLGYFKYVGFFATAINQIIATSLEIPQVVLPLAISFFTFQQISYLRHCFNEIDEPGRFLDYLLYVCFFPQLIAGPIVDYKIFRLQINNSVFAKFNANNAATGLAIFTIGLAKKVLLADKVAPYASTFFNLAATDGIGIIDSWLGALAFTLQLYFDFSGYSDMAIGLAWMFGLRLPVNFESPYKAKSIADFWRRWHITLSNFLRDYLYIPLGGNRNGAFRQVNNLLVTMVLGGLWHGAGWTFLLWGLLHGLFLVAHRLWSKYWGISRGNPVVSFSAWALTFVCVLLAWVPFKANNLETAFTMWQAMAMMSDIPQQLPLAEYNKIIMLLTTLFCIATLSPNLRQIFGDLYPAVTNLKEISVNQITRHSSTRNLSGFVGVFSAVLLLVMLYFLSQPSEFLYFQF